MKLLVIEACLVNYNDDAGGQHQDPGDLIDVAKDTAVALVHSGRALYVAKNDDPSKGAHHTASKDMLDAAASLAKGNAKKEAV